MNEPSSFLGRRRNKTSLYGVFTSLDDFLSVARLPCKAATSQSGMICKARCKRTRTAYLLKMYRYEGDNAGFCLSEIHALTKIAEHPHLIKFVDYFETDAHMVMVLRWSSGGDLLMAINNARQRFTEQMVFNGVLRPVLQVLQKLHESHIIHRDIKPENIVLDTDGTAILVDFGLSIDSEKYTPRACVGTLDFVAPEMLQNCDKNASVRTEIESGTSAARPAAYGSKVDLWSVGVLAYELLIGRLPFTGDIHSLSTPERIVRNTQHVDIATANISTSAKSFLGLCLQTDPAARAEAASLLEHPAIQRYSILSRTQQAPPSRLEGLVALLIHKDIPTIKSHASTLSELGMTGMGCSNAKQACALLQDGMTPHIVFIDLVIAKQSLGEIRERLKQKVPVIVFVDRYAGRTLVDDSPYNTPEGAADLDVSMYATSPMELQTMHDVATLFLDAGAPKM